MSRSSKKFDDNIYDIVVEIEEVEEPELAEYEALQRSKRERQRQKRRRFMQLTLQEREKKIMRSPRMSIAYRKPCNSFPNAE